MATEQQTILIVDDHPLFREGLRQMIERNPEWLVCGEASDAAEAQKMTASLQPDLVIIDISLGGSSGIDLIKTLKGKDEELPILVISMHDETLPEEAVKPPLLVTGEDLIAAGYRPGPRFREMLAAAEDAQLEGHIASKDEGLALVRAAFPVDAPSPLGG